MRIFKLGLNPKWTGTIIFLNCIRYLPLIFYVSSTSALLSKVLSFYSAIRVAITSGEEIRNET